MDPREIIEHFGPLGTERVRVVNDDRGDTGIFCEVIPDEQLQVVGGCNASRGVTTIPERLPKHRPIRKLRGHGSQVIETGIQDREIPTPEGWGVVLIDQR